MSKTTVELAGLEAGVSKDFLQFLSYSCLIHLTCSIMLYNCVAYCELQGFSLIFPSDSKPVDYTLVNLEGVGVSSQASDVIWTT